MEKQNMTDNNTSYKVAADELREFVDRMERLEENKQVVMSDQKEVLNEAKDKGYDAKTIRKIIAIRKRDKMDLDTEEALLTMYREALGM
jgi:uncharacterized protein (UPF0335 family)